jgi:hypothetical protein
MYLAVNDNGSDDVVYTDYATLVSRSACLFATVAIKWISVFDHISTPIGGRSNSVFQETADHP